MPQNFVLPQLSASSWPWAWNSTYIVLLRLFLKCLFFATSVTLYVFSFCQWYFLLFSFSPIYGLLNSGIIINILCSIPKLSVQVCLWSKVSLIISLPVYFILLLLMYIILCGINLCNYLEKYTKIRDIVSEITVGETDM